MTVIEETDAALAAHWSLLGAWPRGEVHDEHGVRWYETPIRHLPYNGVVRCAASPDDADAAIDHVLARIRDRGADCVWFVPSDSGPADLGMRLAARGLRPVEHQTYMSLDRGAPRHRPQPDGVEIGEVLDDDDLLAYARLAEAYWEVPAPDRELVDELHRALAPGIVPGHRYLARVGGEVVGKGYLSLAGPPGVGSIYGMSTLPAARGRGVAGAVASTLVDRAFDEGCRRVVLHSSDMAARLYRSLGFVEHCMRPVYATAAIWSGGH